MVLVMIGHISAPIVLLTAVVLVSLLGSSAASTPCCSQSHRTCESWTAKTLDSCKKQSDGKLVWLPGGNITKDCIERSRSNACKVHEDCCGSLVCDGLASNVRDKKCHHPIDLCRSFRDGPYCNTRSSCMWNGTQCIPNFDFSVYNPDNTPKNIPDDPGCCSQNFRNCPLWTPKMQPACAADRGNLVWLPEGNLSNTCIERGKTDTCKVHEDCCGSLVCDGLASNVRDKKCYHPIDLCRSFRDGPYCNTRSSCRWNGTQCLPNFDFTVYNPANTPKNIPDDPGCCSQNFRTCPTWTPKMQPACAADRGNLVWLPGGELNTTCIERWKNNTCKVHEDCCGSLVCDGLASNVRDKKCYHPIDLCRSFRDEPYCNTRSSCRWNGTQCIPNFDFTVYNPANTPKNIPDDPGCCSQNFRTCPTWTPKMPATCAADRGNLVWLPGGELNTTCIERGKNDACTVHEDCCGSLVCDGMSWNIKDKKCYHPVDLCRSFRDEPFCKTRSSCMWNGTQCLPNFNFTVYNPANTPKNIPDDPGCCSNNHIDCPTWTPKTLEQCKTTQDGTYVWIPKGNRAVPNADTCLPRGSNGECTKHDDCCGSMICAASPWNALKLLCRHPLEYCSDGNPARQFCNNAPGCTWSSGKCVPSFDYTIVDPAAKGVLPGPRIVKTADNGNADFLGLCKGYVGSVWGDPHFVTFDRRKFDCQATGAFTLVKAEGQMEIQGMLHKRNSTLFASVLVGVAIAYPDIPNVPKIQVSVAEYDSGADTTIMLNSKCRGHLYINGVLQSAKRGDAILGDGYVIVINKSGGVDIQYFNGDTPSSSIRITTGGDPDQSFGCIMTALVCLPFNEPDLLEDTVGLLGTPNGNTTDEWTTPTGSVLTLQQHGKQAFDYCTTHYCIEKQKDSLFVYEKISHKARYSCSHEYPGDIDLSNVPQEILEICGGAEDADCLMEGLLGGPERAVENKESERKISEIAASPKLVPDAKFNLPVPCDERPVGGGKCATADDLCMEVAGKCEIVGPNIGPPVQTSVTPSPNATIAPVTPTLAPAICTGSLEIVKNGNVSLPTGAVTYANGNGSTVTVTIIQKWKTDTISWIAPVYKKSSGNVTCDEKEKVEKVQPDSAISYTLQCESDLGYANLTVLVHDGQYKTISSTSNTYGCAGWGNNDGIVPYELRIPCGSCPGTTPAPVTPAPVTPTAAPVTPTSAPVAPTEAPVTPTPAPATPTEAPVTPTTAPVTPTPAPVAPTLAPVTSTEAPVTTTPAPVTPTSKPTAGPTVGPTAGPTAGPTSGPTAGPTARPPTAAPVSPTPDLVTPTAVPVTPSLAPVTPTEAPLTPTTTPPVGKPEEPTTPTTPICPYPPPGPSECPSDIVQMVDAKTELPSTPITVIRRNETTVTFTISNPFSEDIESVYYQYAGATTGQIICYSESQLASCSEPIEVTAHCLAGSAKALAIVDVWFVDPTVVDGSEYMPVPACCKPEEVQSSMPTVQYTFKVYCESTCVESTTTTTPEDRRTLSGHVETNSKSAAEFERGVAQDLGISLNPPQEDNATGGHFCSSMDYPCGEKGNNVYVCHYSTKDGYQTYCVPESDSDVIAYVPKDYCGSCVGEYQSATYRN